jgi:hypothetical protein
MGNRRHKPPELLQGKGSRYRGTASVALMPPDAEREIPPCPRGLTKAARAWYAAFCADPLSQLITTAAWPKVQRLAVLLAKREVVEKKIWAAPTVAGSMGQDVINPLVTYLKELNREIEKIEAGIGLLPQDRMRLGLVVTRLDVERTDLLRRLDRGDTRTDPADAVSSAPVIDLDALG